MYNKIKNKKKKNIIIIIYYLFNLIQSRKIDIKQNTFEKCVPLFVYSLDKYQLYSLISN